ncbi:hypothetical protein KGY79_06885 [Candidatus Bipolaricaulota bacterium]|nr:hypothetical protein [Candidatus Bipolaricaulota bacterium]
MYQSGMGARPARGVELQNDLAVSNSTSLIARTDVIYWGYRPGVGAWPTTEAEKAARAPTLGRLIRDYPRPGNGSRTFQTR